MDTLLVALGALWATQEQIRRRAQGAAGAALSVVGPAATIAVAVTPAPVRRALADAAHELEAQGRTAASISAAEAARLAEAFADRLGREPAVLNLVDRVVDHVQWRVVDTVLPVVLERLAAEPDQVRAIVQGQSRGIVDEVTQAARSRAVAGDEAVAGFLARLLRRSQASEQAHSGEGTGVMQANGLAVEP